MNAYDSLRSVFMNTLRHIVFSFVLFASISCARDGHVAKSVDNKNLQELQEQFYANREMTLGDTTLVGGYVLGMNQTQLVKHLIGYDLSDCYFPDGFVKSSLVIGHETLYPYIGYYFNEQGGLSQIRAFFKSESLESVAGKLIPILGTKYFLIKPSAKNQFSKYLWFNNNQCYYLCNDTGFTEASCELRIINTKNVNGSRKAPLYVTDLLKLSYAEAGRSIDMEYDVASLKSPMSIKYDGEVFTWKWGVHTEERDEDAMRETYYTNISYGFTTEDPDLYDAPNGRIKGHLSYFNGGMGVNVALIKGDWVEVRFVNKDRYEEFGWMRKTDLVNPSYDYTYKDNVTLFSSSRENYTPFSEIYHVGLIQEHPQTPSMPDSEKEYWQSISREQQMRDAGFDEMADREKKERQKKVRSGEMTY